MFTGRVRELAELEQLLADVRDGGRRDRGKAVLLRGRRRVGKSSLVTEFIQRAGVPSFYFQAARRADPADELAEFTRSIAESDLPNADVADATPVTLTAALSLLAAALPTDIPSIAVIDEAPWLLEGFSGGAGELQRVWDRTLARRPVLFLLLGSDLAMMEELTGPAQPFHGRATEMILNPLNPHDVADATGLKPFDAFDAFLITGGMPMVLQEWKRGESPRAFVARSFTRPTSALVVSGVRVLDAEFDGDLHARAVLTAIGSQGERTFSGISQGVAGAVSRMTLTNTLNALAAKRVIAADEPLSTRRAVKDRRWRIEDPSLRFWLSFVQPVLGDIDRGRPDLACDRFDKSYPSWRGRAIEPVVRSSLERVMPNPKWPGIRAVGGWWPRNNNPEVDLIGADGRQASSVGFVGTIKWRSSGRIASAEIDQLARDAMYVPGVDVATPLIAVTGSAKLDDPRIVETWNATQLVQAWSPHH